MPSFSSRGSFYVKLEHIYQGAIGQSLVYHVEERNKSKLSTHVMILTSHRKPVPFRALPELLAVVPPLPTPLALALAIPLVFPRPWDAAVRLVCTAAPLWPPVPPRVEVVAARPRGAVERGFTAEGGFSTNDVSFVLILYALALHANLGKGGQKTHKNV